jgi:transmembrane sensor
MRGERSRESIRAEAAAWVARLNDAHSAADRRRFEEWIAKDPDHQQAYERVAATFRAAAALDRQAIGPSGDLDVAFGRRSIWLRPLVAATAAAAIVIGLYQFAPDYDPLRPLPLASVMLSTGTQSKTLVLADGSRVSMAPASEVAVELNRSERRAEVRKGKARFTVEPESRVFRIVAGTSERKVREGVFDAQVDGPAGIVVPVSPERASSSATLQGGQAQAPGSRALSGPLHSTLEFNAEPLGRVVERINALNGRPIIELQPGLAGLPVTGLYQQGGSRSLARSLALAFDLELVETPAATLLLTRKN